MNENKSEERKDKSIREKSKTYKCFVLQPFEIKEAGAGKTDFNQVYEALNPLQKKKPSMPLELTRADIKSYEDDELRGNLHRQLKKSDFFIADVTGNNPNVLCEIGFVMGIKGKKLIILITQDPESIPANLKALLYVRYDTKTLENLAKDIEQHLPRVKKAIDSTLTSDHYDVKAYAKRSNVDFNLMFEEATAKIAILQTNLVTIGTNHLNALKNALQRNDNLKIMILTLDPQSQYVGVRGIQLRFEDISVYRNELASSLDLVKCQFDDFKGRVKIRKYDDFPSQLTYIVDDQVVSSVISVTGRSRDNCAFVLDKNRQGVNHSFIDHFEKLWEHAKIVLD